MSKLTNNIAVVSAYSEITSLEPKIDKKLEEIFNEHPKAKIRNITSTVSASYLIATIWYQYKEPSKLGLLLDKILMRKNKKKGDTE